MVEVIFSSTLTDPILTDPQSIGIWVVRKLGEENAKESESIRILFISLWRVTDFSAGKVMGYVYKRVGFWALERRMNVV